MATVRDVLAQDASFAEDPAGTAGPLRERVQPGTAARTKAHLLSDN